MPKVPSPEVHGLNSSTGALLLVSEQEVDLSSRKNTVLVKIKAESVPRITGVVDWQIALTPPAAAQLARGLRKAVKDYLRQSLDEPEND